ncbi:unnamed protein product [Moneuplotes crassus]|uniref:Uncharacterized protein n=1 Tax=Euplotes crassus TaxID=5936 RepID=A0AAD1UN30_EUPCR|nr:unnamed protein product [Moneuplotes crassus]
MRLTAFFTAASSGPRIIQCSSLVLSEIEPEDLNIILHPVSSSSFFWCVPFGPRRSPIVDSVSWEVNCSITLIMLLHLWVINLLFRVAFKPCGGFIRGYFSLFSFSELEPLVAKRIRQNCRLKLGSPLPENLGFEVCLGFLLEFLRGLGSVLGQHLMFLLEFGF